MKTKFIFLSVIFLLVVVNTRAQLIQSKTKRHIYETTRSFKIDPKTKKEYEHNDNNPMKLVLSSTAPSDRGTVEITYQGKTTKYETLGMCIVGIYKDGIATNITVRLKDAPFDIGFTRLFNVIMFMNKEGSDDDLNFVLDDNQIEKLAKNIRYYQSLAKYILIDQDLHLKCSACNGTGINKGFYDSVTCDKCNGKGYK